MEFGELSELSAITICEYMLLIAHRIYRHTLQWFCGVIRERAASRRRRRCDELMGGGGCCREFLVRPIT